MKFILAVCCFVCTTLAQAQALQAPEIAARAYLLIDTTARQVLAEKNADTPVEPASLTKLMTAYLVFDALRAKKLELEQTLPVSEKAWRMSGSRMFIDPRMKVPVQDLLKGMIVQSGNDATMALAEGVAGSEEAFVRRMNAQAQALGMKSTGYKNPEGLTQAGHVSTARDLSILATRLLNDFPEYMHFYAIKKYHYPGTPAANDSNRNLLLFKDPSVDGFKTGYTDAAGYCMVATARRAQSNLAGNSGRRLLTVVLGASSENARAQESQKLLNWGFTAWEAIQLFAPNQAVLEPSVWKGQAATVRLGQSGGIVAAVPRGMASTLKTQVLRPDPLVAPLARGQRVATLRLLARDQTVADIPLFALDAVPETGILGRAVDAIRLWIR